MNDKKKLFVLMIGIAGCGEMVGEENAIRAAEGSGMTGVAVTGKHGIAPKLSGGCGEDDAVAFDVEGKSASGFITKATVCCGLVFKGCTVRY